MEFVALSDTVLRSLAMDDRELRRVFHGVFPADRLPPPTTKTRAAYIVNTDPAGEPGQHWLGIWTEKDVCEVFDSYGLPLTLYANPTLQAWFQQWRHVVTSDMTVQAMDSQTCGHYALFFLKARAAGHPFTDFLARFNSTNLVLNDHRIAQDLRRLLKQELYDQLDGSREGEQRNQSRFTFCNLHPQ